MDRLTPEQRSRNMRAIKSCDSKIEILLRKELWSMGLRYRKNVKSVYGKPDIAFISKKVAVFCDSEFWHGKDWDKAKDEIKTRKRFWQDKIEKNILRDRQVNEKLKQEGWVVIRFWGKDIMKDTKACANIVKKELLRNG